MILILHKRKWNFPKLVALEPLSKHHDLSPKKHTFWGFVCFLYLLSKDLRFKTNRSLIMKHHKRKHKFTFKIIRVLLTLTYLSHSFAGAGTKDASLFLLLDIRGCQGN